MSKAKVFVIMPFSEEFFESYEMIKNHFEGEFEFSHAGDEDNQQNILADIIPPIYNADIVLADLTNLNANVMYELGIAHSFNKKTIIITRDEMSKLPFDLKQYRTKGYSTHFKKFFDLIEYLDKHLHGAIDGSVVFNNPVYDFLDKNQIDPKQLFAREAITIELDNSDKGFIDFLADIEEDTEKMTAHIMDMSDEMNMMSTGVKSCTNEIERVKKTGGNSQASFIRKQTKIVANYVGTFSKQLKEHNDALGTLWSGVEKNILGLLENDFASKERNKESLVGFLKSLFNMKVAINESNDSVKGMKEASLKNMGLERSLNQSIRFLDEDLDTYLNLAEQMCNSIDRILTKSKFVVGEIDVCGVCKSKDELNT